MLKKHWKKQKQNLKLSQKKRLKESKSNKKESFISDSLLPFLAITIVVFFAVIIGDKLGLHARSTRHPKSWLYILKHLHLYLLGSVSFGCIFLLLVNYETLKGKVLQVFTKKGDPNK